MYVRRKKGLLKNPLPMENSALSRSMRRGKQKLIHIIMQEENIKKIKEHYVQQNSKTQWNNKRPNKIHVLSDIKQKRMTSYYAKK